MNRVIKFRAWDKTNGWMIPDYDNWISFDGKYWTSPARPYDTPNQEIVSQSNVELMQFTGLLDKNGTEIYEGDIVKSDLVDTSGRYESIYWRNDLCGWSIPGENHAKHYEVLGNIYENPELLKESK